MVNFDILESIEDPIAMTSEEEKDYYSGVGIIEFFVIQNHPDTFEIELNECSGCAQWLNESIGIEYALGEHYFDTKDKWKQGKTYRIEGVTVFYTRGDGWEIEDDEDWNHEKIITLSTPIKTLLHQIHMLWWQNIGFRLRKRKKYHD